MGGTSGGTFGLPGSPSVSTYGTSYVSEAWLQTYRFDMLWKLANKFGIANAFYNWNLVLDRIWAEISADIVESSDIFQVYLAYNKKLSDTGMPLSNNEPEGFTKPYDGKEDIMWEHRRILMEKERHIRYAQNKVGKGTKYRREDLDDWE